MAGSMVRNRLIATMAQKANVFSKGICNIKRALMHYRTCRQVKYRIIPTFVKCYFKWEV